MAMISKTQADWQQAFVATNLLALGYNAWGGFLIAKRGAVVCSLEMPRLGAMGESFDAHYVPRARMAAFLNAWLAAPSTTILDHHHVHSHILQAVDFYNPKTDAILLLESAGRASFLYLRNLPIAPPRSYEIICRDWEEFYLAEEVSFSETSFIQIDLTCE
ncbi:MAG: hypothetical protein AAFY11_13215 [Cyanobacteria bacterium J06641_5]